MAVRRRKPADTGSVGGDPGAVPEAPRPLPGSAEAAGCCTKRVCAGAVLGVAVAGLLAAAFWPTGALGPCPVYFRRLASGSLAGSEAVMQFVPASLRWFTKDDLAAYNGTDEGLPLLLAIGGEVFDVTAGARFYGPDGPYKIFAARDSSRALTKGSLNEEDWKGDKAIYLGDFQDHDWNALRDQVHFYRGKYRLAGGLVGGAHMTRELAEELGGVALQAWHLNEEALKGQSRAAGKAGGPGGGGAEAGQG
ncbi:hypothetical protein FNF29_01026 [Cafeteria roenbergensis]|uniref:Cytochrome b5 heme-binding domain-containing protein n=1 Tax=Cafeteria roenbergensis TaxID=33653 RepID=A0A5A8DHL9_CAFRO|nr:hypothetical protein FNF29_01026 [Cafeteria roenbergensis]KAA0160968.1 hypothetical protein FNF31_04040 [Cafeteria roenbergensis]KAA0164569.1 hypothetical protein FNF28_03811 [Cafeteria roenbergensis]|eukprot:KAA0156236.1 hypothetical protein FNF29_01026 [Cafeteria roenbergensis]